MDFFESKQRKTAGTSYAPDNPFFKLIAVPHKMKPNMINDKRELYESQLKKVLSKLYECSIEDHEFGQVCHQLDEFFFLKKDEDFRKEFVPKFIDKCIRNAITKFDLQ